MSVSPNAPSLCDGGKQKVKLGINAIIMHIMIMK